MLEKFYLDHVPSQVIKASYVYVRSLLKHRAKVQGERRNAVKFTTDSGRRRDPQDASMENRGYIRPRRLQVRL